MQGSKQIFPDDRIKVEVTDEEVILTCKSAIKADEGPYKLELKNKLGTDIAEVRVNVAGKML